MIDHYILDEHGEPKQAALLEWAKWYESHRDRHVAKDETETPEGSVLVSTVFLAVNHNFGDGPPLLWETMIFGGPHDGYQDRYASKAAAIEGHKRALALVRGEVSA